MKNGACWNTCPSTSKINGAAHAGEKKASVANPPR